VNPLGLLSLAVAKFYGWTIVPPQYAADVWNILGGVATICLLVALTRKERGLTLAVVGWWGAEELLQIGCSAWYMVKPWPVALGAAQCSSLLGYDLGKIGAAWAALMLVLYLRRRT